MFCLNIDVNQGFNDCIYMMYSFFASLQIHGSYGKLKILLTKSMHVSMCTEEKKSGSVTLLYVNLHISVNMEGI